MDQRPTADRRLESVAGSGDAGAGARARLISSCPDDTPACSSDSSGKTRSGAAKIENRTFAVCTSIGVAPSPVRPRTKGGRRDHEIPRPTTAGRFVRPSAHAEEMYNPAANGRSEGGWFRIVEKAKP
jgi:hypothetical protein